jgi:hypothetical protein
LISQSRGLGDVYKRQGGDTVSLRGTMTRAISMSGVMKQKSAKNTTLLIA